MSVVKSFIKKHIKDEYGTDGFATSIYIPEDCKCEVCKALDMYGGNDYIVSLDGIIKEVNTKLLVSYAARDQSEYDRAFKSFTIRYKTDLTQAGQNGAWITEWQKRKWSNVLKTSYSTYTMQVYQTEDVYFCGVALNDELNRYIQEYGDEVTEVNRPNFYFKVIWWNEYKNKGNYFKYYEIQK